MWCVSPTRRSTRSGAGSRTRPSATRAAASTTRCTRAQRLLIAADERITTPGRDKLKGLLAAGDPRSEVRTAWHAKEVVSVHLS
jgi:hypothetical protein